MAENNNKSGGRGREFSIYHLPVLVFGILILGLSSIPDLSPPIKTSFPLDKVIHFIEYAGFAYLSIRSTIHLFSSLRPSIAYLTAVLFVSLFAIADENYQRLIPGRTPDVLDVLSDLAGAFAVLTVVWMRKTRPSVPKEKLPEG